MAPLRAHPRGSADSSVRQLRRPRMYGYGARREADYVVNLRGMNRKFDDSERRQDAVPGVVGMLTVSAP